MPEQQQKNIVTDNTDLSLAEILLRISKWKSFFLNKKRYLLVAIIFGIIVGFIYSKLDKPKFNAVLTFVVDEDKGGLGGGAMGLASQLFDIGSGGANIFNGPNLIDLIKSKLIVENTLLTKVNFNNKKLTLLEYYEYLENDKKDISKFQNFQDNERAKDSLLNVVYKKIIKNNLKIEQKDKKISIITIEVQSIDEMFSKLFCESIAKEVSDFYILTKSKKAKINVDILQKQADSIRGELNISMYGVASGTDNIYNLNPSLFVKRFNISKNQINVQANTAILTQLVANLELAKVSLRKETPLIQIIDNPKFPLERKKVNLVSAMLIGSLI